ncbi:hypothetical protein IJH24_00330 [Candidatus Saccharibacteria bacterium]|nr:hypothetical protein [Candidatus Saccharibacteria bacterium]
MRGFLRKVSCVVLAIIFAGLSPVSTFALSSSQLNMFSQNNILFYNPDDGCKVTPNDIYKGAQYSLTDEEIAGFARAADNENNCNLNAIKSELSIMANLFEANGSDSSSIVDYVKNGGWFSDGTVAAFNDTSKEPKEEYIQAVKDVLVNGNRVIPPEIDEHDCIGDIEWLEVNGEKHYATNPGNCKGTGLSDKSLYVSGQTKIHNKYGAEYTFYQWAGGKDSNCGDPFGYSDKAPSESYSTVAGSNTNYAGAQVWSEAELQKIEENRPFYEEAANQYGFPWQILAVLHSHETSLRRYNPDNGQGVYQLYSYTGGGSNSNRFTPASSISEEEFRRQTLIAAKEVSEMVSDLNTPGGIKRLFFQYNGTADVYIQKAINMGFSREDAENGEGSMYVMNRYDARRDPTSSSMDSLWPGRFVADGVYDSSATSNGFGAYVQYEALAGSSYCSAAGGPIAQVAVTLSWPDHRVHSKNDPKPEYVTAMKEVDAYRSGCEKPTYCAPIGASCDQFVGTVMRYSKADPEFPIFGPATQEKHMLDHPEMYMKVEANNDVNNLQPGDILVTTHNGCHILLYVGELEGDGQHYQASASFDDRTGEHYATATSLFFHDDYNGGRNYTAYRRINQ